MGRSSKKRPARRAAQQAIAFRTHGGARSGAGRKPKGRAPMISHAAREAITARDPVLVTLKVKKGVWGMRGRRAFGRVLAGLAAARARFGTRVIHFSVQHDHVHLIVESDDRESLSRAMQGLCVRLARALNRLMERAGAVFADRYHARVLGSPKQARHALAYVLCNARKHGVAPRSPRWLDPMSSARAFDGWRGVPPDLAAAPVASPRSWLLRVGWRRHGLLDPAHAPGAMPA